MHRVRRSAAMTLLLLLAVTFGPLLCRAGGDQDWTAAATTAAVQATAPTGAASGAERARPAAGQDGPQFDPIAGQDGSQLDPTAGQDGPQFDPAAPVAVADAPKRCSNRHAPGPEGSAPLPAPHRAEPLAPATTGPGPLAADLPVQFALARPPTDSASATDHTALLPVLRI